MIGIHRVRGLSKTAKEMGAAPLLSVERKRALGLRARSAAGFTDT